MQVLSVYYPSCNTGRILRQAWSYRRVGISCPAGSHTVCARPSAPFLSKRIFMTFIQHRNTLECQIYLKSTKPLSSR